MASAALFIPPLPPPAADNLPALQAFRAFRTNALTAFPQAAYEEEAVTRRFLGQTRIILNHPDAIRHVLIDNAENYVRTRPTIRILRPLIGDGLFLSTGENWRHQRRTLAAAFTPRMTALLAPLMARSAQDMVEALAQHENTPFDALRETQNLALEIAGRTMFSLEMRRYGGQMRRDILDYASRLGRPYLADFFLPLWLPNPYDIRRALFRRRWMRLIRQMIADRLAQPSADQPRDMFDLLAAARDPRGGKGLSENRLADEVATLIVAGHETTALTLFWSLYLLAEAPEIQEAVAAEVKGISLSPADAAQSLEKLPYTKAVIQETLRLYPPAFAILRTALKPDRAGPAEIPPGAIVLISPWVLHRHKNRWVTPDGFDPARFLADGAPPDRFSFLPFGIGPRICIGAQFALTEAVLVLAIFIQKFYISRSSNEAVLPNPIITSQPGHAPPFQLKRRR